jgi:hypothetical protein
MPTFEDLSIEFPLFGADVEEAAGWQPSGICEICSEARAGFQIGIGDYIEVRCQSCGAATPVPAGNRPEACVNCQTAVQLGRVAEDTHGCWTCLRDGRWSSTKDTEAGMVTPAHAELGRTHGLPFPPGPIAETAWTEASTDHPTLAGWPAAEPNEDGWRAAMISTEVLRGLVRSPNYISWQGEQWLFHCGRPMRYLGLWGKLDFNGAAADGDGRSLAARSAALPHEMWQYLSDRGGESAFLAYMFECSECHVHRGHWDTD